MMITTRIALIAALAASFASAQAPLLDSTSRSYSTGSQVVGQAYRPDGLALADLDGDGDLDAALAHLGDWVDPRVSLLFNHGDGTYAAPVFLKVSGETDDVVAGDFDSDGDADLAFAQGDGGISGQSVLVFLNNGNGTFGPQQSFPCGKGPLRLVTVDVDKDGDLDLVTANNYWSETTVSVLYNNGTGSFATRVDFPVGAAPLELAAGDLNGDGFPDLAVCAGIPNLAVLLNNGAGAYGAPATWQANATGYSQGPGLAIADMDKDGDLDIVLDEQTGGYSGSLAIFKNNGNANFANVQHVQATNFFSMWDIAVADVTGDGWPDVLGVGYASAYGYALVPSAGGGAFGTARAFRTGEMARAIEVGDADGDGDLDVLVVNWGSMTLTVHTGEAGTFEMPPVYLANGGAGELATADLDRDGDLDVATVASDLTILRNGGNRSFSLEVYKPLKGAQSTLRLADFNGDLYPDVVTLDDATSPPYEVHVSLNPGDGTFGPFTSYLIGSCGPGDVVPIDFDEDGDLDLVVTEYLGCGGGGSGNVLILLSNNGSGGFSSHSTIATYSLTKPERIEAGDFDEDGHMDLVTTHADSVAFWRGHGNGSFDVGVLYSIGDWAPKYLTVADLDGDGHLDVATSNFGNTFQEESVSILRGWGDGGFKVPKVIYGLFSIQYGNPAGIDAADMDADGDLDLIAGAYGADDVAVFVNLGNGAFAPEQRYGVDGVVHSVVAADLDGDGAVDVAVSIGMEPPIQSAISLVFGVDDPAGIKVYCTSKTSSLGCSPAIAYSGSPSVSSPAPFTISASGVVAQKFGLFFYGFGPAAFPFQGGTLCAQPPLHRTLVQTSGGSSGSCSGSYSMDFNAWIQSGADPLLLAGKTVNGQYWFRDPQDPAGFGTGLTDALEFTVQP